MIPQKLKQAFVRVFLLASGFSIVYAATYAAGIMLVPLFNSGDRALISALNPDAYVPGVDQFFRALTDYSIFSISLPLISWMVAYGLYRLIPVRKEVFTFLLGLEAAIVLGMAAMGRIWPNSAYAGANVLFVLLLLATFSGAMALFQRMSEDGMRRFSRLFWLVLLSSLLTSLFATSRIKESVARPRPMSGQNEPWNEALRTIPDELLRGSNSFPSGHTSGTFAILTPFFWFVRDRRGRAGILAWGVLQAYSRVYTVAHFPFDVLMGGLLGFGVGTLVFFTLWGPSLRGPGGEPAETVERGALRAQPAE